MTPVIATTRLRLRPQVVEDAEALFPFLSDVDAMTWWSHPPHTRVEQTRQKLLREEPGWRAWAITLADDGTVIGTCSAAERRQGGVSEIGYLLGRPYWGAGFAHEAVAALISHLFTVDGQRRVFADTDPDNAASRALLERFGFTLEGRLRGEWATHIGVRDSLIYGLLREEWQ